MRILVVAPGPNFSVADVQHGWERALARLGHEVRTYNLNDRLPFFEHAEWPLEDGTHARLDINDAVRLAVEPLGNACYKWWPDLVMVISGFFIPEELWKTWRIRGHKVVYVCTESPYEDNVQFERMMKAEPTLTLINDPINLHRYHAFSKDVHYFPHAHDPEFHCPGPSVPEYECDFGFVGTGYPSRMELFEEADWAGLYVKLGGNWPLPDESKLWQFLIDPDPKACMDNVETVKLYRSAKVSANLYRARTGTVESNDERLREGFAVGPREIELAACGTFFARESRPEGDELFPHLPIFESAQELTDIVWHYVVHDDERVAATLLSRKAVEDRTFDANARRLMQLLPD